MLSKKLLAALAAAVLAVTFAIAQEEKPAGGMMDSEMMEGMSHDDMMSMMTGKPKGDQGPSSMAFAKANATMHSAMNIEFSGNADVDFAKGMIAHHEGAIEMSKVVLEFGKDAEMKKLAEQIIAAQGPEIEQMQAWLAKQ
jgi:uncharacterized protein (DUF305 family)